MARVSTLLSRVARPDPSTSHSTGARTTLRGAVERRRASDQPVRPRWQAALIAALGAAAAVLVPLQLVVLLGWLTADTAAGSLDALAVGAYGWLLGHGVPLALGPGAGAVTLHPLGLLVVVLVLLHRGGQWAARACGAVSGRAVGVLVAEICIGYAALVAGVTAVTANGPARPSLLAAAVAGLSLAALGAGTGALRASGQWSALRARAPRDLRVALDAGAGATLVLLAGSALVLLASLVVHFPRAVGLSEALGPGVTGGPVLLALNLVLVPNAVLYALAFAAGPGFSLGVGTLVWLGGSSAGPLPAVALLAAVPEGAATPPYAYAVLLVPLAAGVAAGLLAVTRGPDARAEQAALRGLYAGGVAGALTAGLSWLASGSLGAGRLVELGLTAWLVGLVVAVEVAVVGAATAWVACPRAAPGDPAVEATSSAADTQASEQVASQRRLAVGTGGVRVGAARAAAVVADLRPEDDQQRGQDERHGQADATQDDGDHAAALPVTGKNGGPSGPDAHHDRDDVEDEADRKEDEREQDADNRVVDGQPTEPASPRELLDRADGGSTPS